MTAGLDQRYRRVGYTVAANVASKALALAVFLAGVAWTLPYLGTERFGVWMTLASFAALLSFLDLGAGNALLNRVARAAAAEPPQLAQVVTGGMACLAGLALVATGVLAAAAQVLPWHRVIRVSDPALVAEARSAALVFAVLFGCNIVSSGLARVFAGLQEAHRAHLLTAAAQATALAVLFAASRQQAGVGPLLLVTFGLPVLATLGLAIPLHRRGLLAWRLVPRAARAEWAPLLRVGGLFLALQIGTMIGWGADAVLIASTLGAAHVALFSVVQRLFQFVSQPLAIANAPLWQAYADADIRGDRAFIRKTLARSTLLTLVGATVGGAVAIVAGPFLIGHWTDHAIEVTPVLLALFAAWTVLETVGNAFAMFLNGCGIVRPQVVVVILFCAVTLPLKWVSTQAGVPGVVLAGIVGYTACIVLPYAFVYRRQIQARLTARP